MARNNCECTHTGLDIFTVPPLQTSVEHGCWVEYHPLATLTDSGPVEFEVKGDGEHYLDLSNSFIHTRIKVVKDDNTTIENFTVVPTNLLLHALFQTVDVSLNGTLISSSSNTYPYRAYLETLLNYGQDAKQSQLNLAGYYVGNINDDDNKNIQKRQKTVNNSKTLDLIGKLHDDIFSQDKYLLNGVDVRLRFIRSKDAFVLAFKKSDSKKEDYTVKIKMLQMSLFVRKAKLNPVIVLAHGKALQHATAKYPIKRVLTNVHSISQGVMNFVKDNLYLSKRPQKLIIGFVLSKAFNGDFDEDPFNFKHFNINSLALFSDGHQIPSKALTPDFTNDNYARSYLSLFTGCSMAWKDTGIDISYQDYKAGYTIFCFDLSPSLIDGPVVEPVKSGNLRLEVSFAKALEHPIHALIYAESDGLIEIDRARQVITDFGS